MRLRKLPILFLLLLTACSSGGGAPVTAHETPTFAALFDGAATMTLEHSDVELTPSLAPMMVAKTPLPTFTPRPTLAPATPVNTPSVSDSALDFNLLPIFKDELAPGWSSAKSWDVDANFASQEFVHNGAYAISFQPLADYGSVFLTVQEGTAPIRYEDVLGVVFYLNPGEESLFAEELAVTIVGSNDYTYFTEDDTSVEIDDKTSFFSETRLSYLDVNNEIPPGEWVEIFVWLDNLPYDPNYTYITGIYFKTGEGGFRNTIYVDDISLLLVP